MSKRTLYIPKNALENNLYSIIDERIALVGTGTNIFQSVILDDPASIFNATITPASLSANRAVVFPNYSGDVILSNGAQSLTDKTIYAALGSVGSPSYSFSGNSNTGIYSSGTNTLNFATNGINQLAMSTTAITSTLPIFCPSTTALTNCGLQIGLANTGLQYNAGVLYFGLGGTQMMRFQAAQIYSSAPHNFTSGSVSAPSITNPSYQTTGLSFAAGPILNVSVSAVRRAFWNTTGYAIGDLGDAVARKNFGTYTFTAPNLAQHGTTSTTITYANAFASTPRIYLTTSFNSATSTYMYGVLASASDVGTTTFKINICNLVNNSTTGDIVVNWIAEL